VIDANKLIRIETELAAVMPAPHTLYSLPLARPVGEPLGLAGTSGQSAYQVQVKGKPMHYRLTLVIEAENAMDLDRALEALKESDLGDCDLENIKIEAKL
jgi:hypothetical protein